MELVQLRFRAVCKTCHSKLPPRSDAYQDPETGDTICPTCHRVGDAPIVLAPAPFSRTTMQDSGLPPAAGTAHFGPRAPASDPNPMPGTSAPLSAQPPRKMPRKVPAPGAPPAGSEPLADWLPAKSTSTVAPLSAIPAKRKTSLPVVGPWLAAGAVAEKDAEGGSGSPIRKILDAASEHGLEILLSRPWTGTAVESEHIVVAPSGVWVVDGLAESDVPYDRKMLSGHSGADLYNVVGGKVSVISGLLFDSEFQWMPVRGALCFEGQPPAWFDGTFTVAGIAITTPRDLIDMLFSPLRADVDARAGIAAHIARRS